MKIVNVSILILGTIFLAGCGQQVSKSQQSAQTSDVQQQTQPVANASVVVTVNKTQIGNQIIIPSGLTMKDIFDQTNKQVDFHVYYPIFIPQEIQLDTKAFWWHEKDPDLGSWSSYILGVPASDSTPTDIIGVDSKQPLIWINQFKIDQAKPTAVLNKNLNNKQEISINGQKGFYGTIGENPYAANLIYSTNDGVAIWISSKSFDTDTLIKVAESMQ